MAAITNRFGALLLRHWRAAVGAGLLLVLSNGPVLRFATGVLDRPGHWNDWAVWPFFAGAAAASAGFAWAVWRPGGRSADRAGRPRRAGREATGASLSGAALVAVGGYSAAAVASSLWSVYPSATLWRSIVYLGLILLAVALAGLSADELSTTLALAAGAAVAASLGVIVLAHSEGVDRHGDWIGVYTNRNSLAPMAALGVIAGLHRLSAVSAGSAGSPRVSPRRVAWGAPLAAASLVAASLVILIGAGSRTAWSALAAALASATALSAAAVWVPRLRLRWGSRRTGATALAAALLAAGAGAAVVAAAWNVSTFSQRRAIWSLVRDRVMERPWGGYGFFAFWEVPELVREHELLQLGSAHNSLVETALGLGVVGTVPLVAIVVLAAFNAGRGLWRCPSADTAMWAAVTVFVLLENTTESFVLWFSHIWVLLLVAALRLSAPASQPGSRVRGRADR